MVSIKLASRGSPLLALGRLGLLAVGAGAACAAGTGQLSGGVASSAASTGAGHPSAGSGGGSSSGAGMGGQLGTGGSEPDAGQGGQSSSSATAGGSQSSSGQGGGSASGGSHACVNGAACTVDLSACPDSAKAAAWKGKTSLQGTLELDFYTSHKGWVCQVTAVTQGWPVITEPGWWCGTVVETCSCSPADQCH